MTASMVCQLSHPVYWAGLSLHRVYSRFPHPERPGDTGPLPWKAVPVVRFGCDPWFVSDVRKKDWSWLLNAINYTHLFPKATEQQMSSLRKLGQRWKVRSFHRYPQVTF